MRRTKAVATVAGALLAVVVTLAGAVACGGTESGTATPADEVATSGPTSADEPTEEPTGTGTTPEPTESPVDLDGVEFTYYAGGLHVTAPQRVAYDKSPPYGGAHDAVWAPCNGAIYDVPVRNEHMVHSLEHGAVWIAYDPARVPGDAVAALAQAVEGEPYLMLSPYPGLDRPVSVQSWGHQLKLDDPADVRIAEFVRELRGNPDAHPEPGATCDVPVSVFDPANPPPFDPTPPGPDAVPVS